MKISKYKKKIFVFLTEIFTLVKVNYFLPFLLSDHINQTSLVTSLHWWLQVCRSCSQGSVWAHWQWSHLSLVTGKNENKTKHKTRCWYETTWRAHSDMTPNGYQGLLLSYHVNFAFFGKIFLHFKVSSMNP